jgi:hypothetical protein
MVYDFKKKIRSFVFHKLDLVINVCGWKLELHDGFY